MKAHKKYDALQFIRSMCTDRLSFDTNFFMLSFAKHGFSPLAETVILVIDYAQLFSQIFLLNHYFYDTSTDPFNTLYQKITPIAKTFCTGHWLSFNSADSTILYLVFALMILYLVIKYLLLAYILIIAAKRYQPFKPFLMVWRFICKLHDRVLYLFYTSFWINIFIAASNEKFDPFGAGSAPTMTAAMVIIIAEFLGSFLVNQRYAYLLPTQSILSTQNTNPIIMNLFFKFLLQIFEFSLKDNDKTSIIVFNSLALVLSIVNTIHYFKALPLYNFRALKLEACLMMEALLLNTVFFIRGVVNVAGDTVFTVDSAVLLAFALTPLTVKGGMAYIDRIVLNLATRNVYTEPELLVHKINAIKHYQQKQKPFTQFSEAYDRAYLVNASYSNRVAAVFDVTNLEDSDKALSIDSREARDRVFRMFLENLASQFPKDNLIKLYLSYYQGTKFKAYGYALKTLFQLEQHASAKMALNARVLIADIQDTLKEEYKNTKSEIDLSTFITSLAAVSAFKEKILEQTELQIKICREFSENAPDLAKIFNLSQKVGLYKENLEKNMHELRGRLLEYNLEPQVLCARYYLVLNHSIMEYIKTIKNLNKKRERYAKQLTEGKLSAESLYNKENAFMMITTQGGSTGTVIHSSRSAEDLFGDNPAGNNAYSIAPPVLQNFFFEFFRNPLDKRNKEYFGHVVRTFAYHKKGKIVEVDFYMNFHPFLSQGLYYNLIVKPIHSTREFIILGKNGMIEGFTEEIGEKLGLTLPQGTAQKIGSNINQISRELGRLSHICMTVAALEKGKIQERFTQISSRSDAKQTFQPFSEDVEVNQNDEKTQDAKVLYSIFNTEGKPLKLSAISNTHRSNRSGLFSFSNVYHCKVQNQFYGSTYIQVLTLEESVADDEEVDQTKQLVWASTESGGGTVVQKLLESQSTTKKGTRQETIKTMERRGSPLFNTMLTTFKTDGLQEDNFMGSEDVSFEKRSEFQISDIPDEHGKPMERTTGLLNLSQMEKASPRKEFKASSSRQEESDTNKLNNDTPIPQGKAEADLHDKWVQDDKNAVAKLQVVQQSLGSQKSRSSAQGRVSKALNEALSVNYSPRYYNMFILGFYALLAGIFATELSSTLTLDTDIGNRKEEKDIIRSSETRNDLLVSIQRELRYIQDLTSGRMTQADLGLVGNTVDGYVSSIRENLAQLATFNNELLQATNNLDEEFRDQLFGANVRVFETTNFSDPDQSYILLNNFQATSRIVETGLKGLDFVNTDISAANQQFMFIFRNALNDFLITCDKISDIFMESLDRKEQNTLSKLDYILYVTIILLVIVVGVSGVVIALQYDNERKNMLAFIRLSPEKVQEVLEGMLRFKRVILEDLNFEEITNVDISKFMKATSKTDAFSKKKGKSHQSTFIQHTNIQGIFRKYLFYMVQILFLTAVLSGFVALNYTTYYNTIVSLHQQLHQIQFSDQLSVRLNVAVITTQELLTNGDTTLIRNQLPSVQVELSLEDIMTIRQELTSSFDASGTSYEATLQNIVYTDACDYLTGTPALACVFTKRGAEQLGLVNAASELESGIAMRIDMYDQSNKTAAALLEIQKETLENTVYPNSIMNSGTSVISDLIEKYYDADLITAKNKSSLLFGVFCGVISVVGLMAWLGVLMKIRRADGEFKKVLQTLPPNLILSNFMLKSYLLKTSGGVLDVVRNEL